MGELARLSQCVGISESVVRRVARSKPRRRQRILAEMMTVRQQVNKALELAREQGILKGSLDASVTLYAEPALAERLRSLGEELRFVLITSGAQVADWGKRLITLSRPKICRLGFWLSYLPVKNASDVGTAGRMSARMPLTPPSVVAA